ncbi:unnamed protein product [Paramecium octaurelia]|uniref:Uncharacterized protein n=1 Tax=Paramecium octaurelia TaxID=43137 RepID=A0A8S1VWA4_PAROT|nr:unnamed protein product [Paramecium octaurelia]
MISKNIFVAPDLNSALQKKVRLCENSQSTTLFNENSNSVESFPTLSKIASKYLNISSLRERFHQINETGNLKASKYQTQISILSAIDSQLLFLKQRRESLFLLIIVKNCYDSQQLQVTTRQLLEILTQSGNYDLLLKFPDKQLLNSSELNSRKELFQYKLESFLQLNGDYLEPFKLPQKPQFFDEKLKKENNQSSKAIHLILQLITMQYNSDTIKAIEQNFLNPLTIPKYYKIRTITNHYLQYPKNQLTSLEKGNSRKNKSQKKHKLTNNYPQKSCISQSPLCYIPITNKEMYQICSSIMYLNTFMIIIQILIQNIGNWLQLIDNPGGQILRLNKEVDQQLLLTNCNESNVYEALIKYFQIQHNQSILQIEKIFPYF